MTTVAAIIQARMASSRLPGKVLMEIEGAAMLGRVVDRTVLATSIDTALVATSVEDSDNPIADFCRQHKVPCFRGSHFDVLDRYHGAAAEAGADVIVRITADCPLIDPELIDDAVSTLQGNQSPRFDFAATRLPPPWRRTFPIGLDVEACTLVALQRAWKLAKSPAEREHVMPYLYAGVELTTASARLRTGRSSTDMRVAVLDCEEDLGDQRWTVDTQADLEFVREIYRVLGARKGFGWKDVRALLKARPELLEINAGVRHKSVNETDDRGGGRAPA